MKHIKMLSALLLTLTLVFSLLLPATAAVNWDEFKVTAQDKSLSLPYGEAFTIGLEATAPEGAQLSYQWYQSDGNDTPIPDATGNSLSVGPDDSLYPAAPKTGKASYLSIFCVISATEFDTEGAVVETRKKTVYYSVIFSDVSFWGKVYGITVIPFMQGFATVAASYLLSGGFSLLLSPFIFIYGLIAAFIHNLQNIL